MKMFDGLQEVNVIRGWRELYDFTQMTEMHLRRAIGLYGFPKPRKLKLKSRRSGIVNINNVWLEDEVLVWLTERANRAENKIRS